VDLSDDFRKNAAECLKRSREAKTIEAQAEWLSMADFWLRLAQHGEERQALNPPAQDSPAQAATGRSETGQSSD
jgi:hypothetical protein